MVTGGTGAGASGMARIGIREFRGEAAAPNRVAVAAKEQSKADVAYSLDIVKRTCVANSLTKSFYDLRL